MLTTLLPAFYCSWLLFSWVKSLLWATCSLRPLPTSQMQRLLSSPDRPPCVISLESLKPTHLGNSVLYWDMYRFMIFKFLDLNSQCILFMLHYSCKPLSSESYFPQPQKEANGSVLSLVMLPEKCITTQRYNLILWPLYCSLVCRVLNAFKLLEVKGERIFCDVIVQWIKLLIQVDFETCSYWVGGYYDGFVCFQTKIFF